jgi:hypothetical protein
MCADKGGLILTASISGDVVDNNNQQETAVRKIILNKLCHKSITFSCIK